MAKYQGGKQRIGSTIHQIILDLEEKSGRKDLLYFEPFVGMCGVMIHFANDILEKKSERKLYGNDLNPDVIKMWEALQNDWIPPKNCSEEEFNSLKKSLIHSPERGFIGTACSFGGAFFSGFRGKYQNSNINDAKSTSNKLVKMKPAIKNINFSNKSYEDVFKNPIDMIIYCDPPYKQSLGKMCNKYLREFDSEKFWNIMREWSKNNIVIISEEQAPDDFISIWSKKTNSSIKKKSRVEQLFIKNTSLNC
jgi:DNA adenine methylase